MDDKIPGWENRPQSIKDAEKRIQETAQLFLDEMKRIHAEVEEINKNKEA